MPLQFRPDGTFTIVQFSDVHWQDGHEKDMQSRRLIELVLDAERPDLVVLTGDNIAGGRCSDPIESLKQLVGTFEKLQVPWVAVFGNHDDEGSRSKAQLMAAMQEHPYCLSEPGPKNLSGIGNFALTVKPAASDTPPAVLYCLDSGAYAPDGIGGYAWIPANITNWYRDTSAEFAELYGEPLNALAFFHIPFPEFETVWEKGLCVGVKQEEVCSPRLNSGLFTAMYECGDVSGVFVGHDHVNDYDGELHGIRLCYGRGSGYNTYGREGFPRGARVICLREGARGFETWLRLADGSRLLQT